MFGIGLPELLVIFALALIVLGPEKLPEVAKQIAKFINQLRRAADEFKSELDLDDIPGVKTDELLKTDAFQEHEKKVQALEYMAKTLYKGDNTPGGLGPDWQVAKGAGERGLQPERPEPSSEGDTPADNSDEGSEKDNSIPSKEGDGSTQ